MALIIGEVPGHPIGSACQAAGGPPDDTDDEVELFRISAVVAENSVRLMIRDLRVSNSASVSVCASRSAAIWAISSITDCAPANEVPGVGRGPWNGRLQRDAAQRQPRNAGLAAENP